MRKTLSLISIFIFVFAFAGCDSPTADSHFSPAQTTAGDTITIASFNIQVFGKTKASKEDIMDILSKIVRRYDLVAIQEVRNKDQTVIPKFVSLINSDGSSYDYIIGSRLGRTSSKEQYAIIYDTETIQLQYPEPRDYPDEEDLFHREPLIAKFKAKNGNFDFVLVDIHTDPDEASEEIPSLMQVYEYAEQTYQDPDIIILGDFNADCKYYNENNMMTPLRIQFRWLIDNSQDTTTKSSRCTYDRILIPKATDEDYTGNSGVFHYDDYFSLTPKMTQKVSDHYPVWAEFYTNRDTD